MKQRSVEKCGCRELPNTEAQYLESRISIQEAMKKYAGRSVYRSMIVIDEFLYNNNELMEGTDVFSIYEYPPEFKRDYHINLPQGDSIDAIESSLMHLRSRGGGKSINSIEKIIQRKFQCKDCELYITCKSSLRLEFSDIICPCFSMNKRIITEIHLADQKIEETKIDTHPRHTIQTTYNKFGEIVNKLEIIL